MSKSKPFDLIANASEKTKELLSKAAQAADRTGDGKFDLDDVAVITEEVGGAVKQGASSLKERADEVARQLERNALQPIFSTRTEDAVSLEDADFRLSQLIRIVPRDKRHAESAICQGSVGYTANQRGLRIVHLFQDSTAAFGLTLYPDCDSELYYMDPSDPKAYIALNEYFSYMKLARINELKQLAQALGAKHFKVTYKEKRVSFTDQKATARGKAAGASGDVTHRAKQELYDEIRVVAETDFPGHAPNMPQLKYLKQDKSIQTLVAMRMDTSSPLLREHLELELYSTSGMKLEDAVKIDAVLKGLKCIGNTTVANEVQNEARRCLEYDITF